MGRRRCGFRGPGDNAMRKAMGFAMILFAFGILFGMLIRYPFLQWLIAIVLLFFGFMFCMQCD